ncbi:glycosyltransferase family 2 protein [Sphingomonas sp.]|uniref:glycosyltransferase family 2 protein n=1 Tax=Sphingomonas sp. TaxID=28214 RepID=UPI003B00DA58
MSTPAVSVVMAAYNGVGFIRETIESVLAQTMPDLEIVVVDDGSKDDTVAVLEGIADPRLRVIRAERNGGPAVARTIAMAHATGHFVAGLDQDDICAPDRFKRQLAQLDAQPELTLLASTIAYFGAGFEGRRDPYPDLVDPDRIDWTMLLANPLAWSTVMMRGGAARALVPFERDERRFAEDFDLYHRIRAHGRIGRIAEPLVRYRMHAAGASTAYEEGMIASTAKVLAERYAGIVDDPGGAGALMSRHVGAGYPPPDAATLTACGQVLACLLKARGHLTPAFARASASAHWWRTARSGLRAGRYGATAMLAARPAFAALPEAAPARLARDGAVGAARRMLRRA